jgi:PAS domain S-box-containing protein
MPTRRVPAEMLSALFEESEVGFAVLDQELRYLGINEALARMNGVTIEDTVGRTLEEVVPAIAAEWRQPFEEVFATGAPIRELELRGTTPAGEGVWLESIYPLRNAAGEIDALGFVVVDIARRAQAEVERDSVNLLLEGVLQRAPVGLAVFDSELRFTRVNDALAEINRRPAAEHIGRKAEELPGPGGERSLELLRQVMSSGKAVNDVALQDSGEGEETERHFLVSYFPLPGGGVGSVVLDATEQVRELRRQKEQARRSEQLRRFADRLAQSARADEVAQALAEDCCATVGMERGLVALVSDRDRALGEVRALEIAASVGYPEAALDPFRRIPIDRPSPGAQAVRDGKPRWFESAADHARKHPDYAELYQQAGNEAGAVIPLLAGGRGLGYLALAHPKPKTFSSEERERVLAIADQAAQALARAFLHEREHELAHALQDSLLPEPVGDHPRIEVSCCYLPAGTIARVGGDWYDVVDLPDQEVLLIVGDIAGHGSRAAAEMAELSAVLRSQALAGAAPAQCLDFLRNYAAARPRFPFATVCCCRLAPDSGELRWARAGHPPPLIAGEQGARYLDDGLGPAIGIDDDSGRPYEEASVQLDPTETVLLYTDGLIEQGRPGYDAGLSSLAERIDSSSCRPTQLVQRIEGALKTEELEDDVALLAFALS